MNLEADVVRSLGKNDTPRKMFGRRQLFTEYDRVDETNVLDALAKIKPYHASNRMDIEYLERYLRGDQPILYRTKQIRGDITNNTVINNALKIYKFWTTYPLAEPIVYVTRNDKSGASSAVQKLNEYMFLAGKTRTDRQLWSDFTTCGVAYRFVYPNSEYEPKSDQAPFWTCAMDPKSTFVVYRKSARKDNRPVFAGSCVKVNDKTVYDIFTRNLHIEIEEDKIKAVYNNPLGEIPIIEYLNDELRMGAFEPVLTIMDSMNELESNRVEAVGQNVQHLTWLNNVNMDDEELDKLNKNQNAFVFTKSVDGQAPADIKTITIDLMQADQQVLANDLNREITLITGMPSIGDGNTADSSNNGSTLVRNGWSNAEARAKDTATLYSDSDRLFVRIALKICSRLANLKLSSANVECKFTRRNYEDIQSKMTVLTTALGCNSIHPKQAYQTCGLFPDPEEAYMQGMQWREKIQAEQMARDEKARAGAGTGGEKNDVADRGSEEGNRGNP